MTITPSLIYWVSVFDRLRAPLAIICCSFGIAAVIAGVFAICVRLDPGKDDDPKDLSLVYRLPVVLGVSFLVTLLMAVLMPSGKDIAFMYVVPKVVNGRVVQEDIPAVYRKLVDDFLKDVDARIKENPNTGQNNE